MKKTIPYLFLLFFSPEIYSQGIAAFMEDDTSNEWKLINEKGEKLFTEEFDYIFDSSVKISFSTTEHTSDTRIIGYPTQGLFRVFLKMRWDIYLT